MKYTEDNIAEIISTEMFVKDTTFMQYSIGLQILERDIEKHKKLGQSWMLYWGEIPLGTEALLSLQGCKIDKKRVQIKGNFFRTISW